jgi:CRP-like cAMP-binding protein
MVDYSAALQECCLKFLDKAEAEALLAVMKKVSYGAGVELFQKGDPAESLYFIVSGRIAVQNKTGFGKRSQVVALLDPGAPVGEKGLLGGGHRGATLTAVKDSELLALTHESFDKLVDDDPALAIKLLKWLLNRVSLRLEKNSERLVHVL